MRWAAGIEGVLVQYIAFHYLELISNCLQGFGEGSAEVETGAGAPVGR